MSVRVGVQIEAEGDYQPRGKASKPIKGAKSNRGAYKPGDNSILTNEKCEGCGKRVTRIVVREGRPYLCSKACAGLPDLAPSGDDPEPTNAELEAES